MQPPRLQDSQNTFVDPNVYEAHPPDPAAVFRAYGAGVGLPSDRSQLDLQAKLVGAIMFGFAGLCLLATAVLLLARWLPAWLVTFGFTLALTALGLALFSSVSRTSRHASSAVQTGQTGIVPAPTQDLSAIEELDPTEVESMRGQELDLDRSADGPRLTPHPIVQADSDAGADSDSDIDDAKTRPLGDLPPAPARKPFRAEMPSNVMG
ncbi:MAG TPA: hypothetical protein VFU02_19860 [Polyangiaceae bacterium]|nr:hypothetical protein [Polyangiaceae bacterium]